MIKVKNVGSDKLKNVGSDARMLQRTPGNLFGVFVGARTSLACMSGRGTATASVSEQGVRIGEPHRA